MASSKTDILLHPIRMRIVMSLAGRQLTPLQLAAFLPDVPQATLYRHLNKLSQEGFLRVVEERQVRGTVEKVYTLGSHMVVGPEELAKASKEELMRLFTNFVSGLLGSFASYLTSREKPDLLADMVGFRQLPLNLTDKELIELIQELQKPVLKVYGNELTPERKRILFSTVLMPDTTQQVQAANDKDEVD